MNDIIDGGYSMILCKEHEKNSFENTDKILKDMPIKIFGSCTKLYWKAWTLKRAACLKLFLSNTNLLFLFPSGVKFHFMYCKKKSNI